MTAGTLNRSADDPPLSTLAGETVKLSPAQQDLAELEGGSPPSVERSRVPQLPGRPPQANKGKDWRTRLVDQAPFLVACVMLVSLVAIYGSLRDGGFTLEELTLDAPASMALLLAATGQTIVLLRGGIDLSIGGMVSLGTVIAATQFGDSWTTATAWGVAILALGLLVGMANGLIISALRLQPFLVTLATWSILSGAALLILPTDGGSLP